LLTAGATKKSPEINKFPAIFIFKIRFMRQDVFLFIRIQIFDIHAVAIRTKNLSLAAGVIADSIQLGSRTPLAAFLTFLLVLAHITNRIDFNFYNNCQKYVPISCRTGMFFSERRYAEELPTGYSVSRYLG
jgi:hypothetical protein